VLLHGYREWGDAFVERLNGMWAFVIYDRAKRRLFGSRDRFGKKPLYYFHEGQTFGFASELSALLQHPRRRESLRALAAEVFCLLLHPAPRSIYERVWKLPGGHSFSYDLAAGELKTWRYWEFVIEPEGFGGNFDSPSTAAMIIPESPSIAAEGWPPHKAYEALCEQIRETLERAVKRRLMSDVPLGVFLSGGIDSSAIAALAAKHVPEGQLNTFLHRLQ
jgi:asparagine synthase (glutamine-hydrolysing)